MGVRYLRVEFGSRGEIEDIKWVERFGQEIADIVDDGLEFVFYNSKKECGVEVGLSEENIIGWYYEGYVKEKLGEDWNFSDEWSESDERIWELCGF